MNSAGRVSLARIPPTVAAARKTAEGRRAASQSSVSASRSRADKPAAIPYDRAMGERRSPRRTPGTGGRRIPRSDIAASPQGVPAGVRRVAFTTAAIAAVLAAAIALLLQRPPAPDAGN